MNNDIKELMSGILKDMSALNYIKPGDVPNINLYMDQVTTFMYEHLHDTKRTTDDKVLTKTMINNYAKNNLLPSPVKKKYSKEHIYILTFIYYFKNILSISDIQKMLNPLTEKFLMKVPSRIWIIYIKRYFQWNPLLQGPYLKIYLQSLNRQAMHLPM